MCAGDWFDLPMLEKPGPHQCIAVKQTSTLPIDDGESSEFTTSSDDEEGSGSETDTDIQIASMQRLSMNSSQPEAV